MSSRNDVIDPHSHGVVGRIDGRYLSVRKEGSRQVFQPELHGELRSTRGGTRVIAEGRIADLPHVFTRGWWLVVAAFALIAGGLAAKEVLSGDDLVLVLLGALVPIFVLAVLAGAVYWAAHEARTLVTDFERLLDEVESDEAQAGFER